MSRATSAGLFGSKPPVDVSRMPARRAPRAYGLVSESAPSGWYSAGSPIRKSRPRRNGAVTSNKPDPATVKALADLAAVAAREAADEETPVRRGQSAARVDSDAERAIIGSIMRHGWADN
jgi:hypothetical protein